MDLKFNGGGGGTSQLCRVGVSSAARQPVTGVAGRQLNTQFNEMWEKRGKKLNHFGDSLFENE